VEPGFSVLRACCRAYSGAGARFQSLSRGVLSPFCGRYVWCPARATPPPAGVASSSRWRPVLPAVVGASLGGRGQMSPHVAAGAVVVPGDICPAAQLAPRAPVELCAAGRFFRGALGVANPQPCVAFLAGLFGKGVKLLSGTTKRRSQHIDRLQLPYYHGVTAPLTLVETPPDSGAAPSCLLEPRSRRRHHPRSQAFSRRACRPAPVERNHRQGSVQARQQRSPQAKAAVKQAVAVQPAGNSPLQGQNHPGARGLGRPSARERPGGSSQTSTAGS